MKEKLEALLADISSAIEQTETGRALYELKVKFQTELKGIMSGMKDLPKEDQKRLGAYTRDVIMGTYVKIKKERDIKDHSESVQVLIEELLENKVIESLDEIKGVGHRVVHGGEKYSDSVLITDEVIRDIEELTKFATLHHPGNLAGIQALKAVLPEVPMVAVYDTAFHQTMPKENYLFPVPMEWYTEYGVRKYGFHGTSHKYITTKMKEKLGKEDVNLIICHIGSGASISAVKEGKCYDTTMGLTPLDGLMMGTRSGAIDPSIIEYVCGETGRTVAEVTNDLNKRSGLLGVAGYSDSRDVENAAAEGNENAALAITMYNNRIAKYIAEYYLKHLKKQLKLQK